MENGLFCFKRGWKFFAQDVGLKFGEFLSFSLNDDGFTLDVSVFETNGCKKEFLDDHEEDEDDELVRRASEETNNPLYYNFVLKSHHKYRFVRFSQTE